MSHLGLTFSLLSRLPLLARSVSATASLLSTLAETISAMPLVAQIVVSRGAGWCQGRGREAKWRWRSGSLYTGVSKGRRLVEVSTGWPRTGPAEAKANRGVHQAEGHTYRPE
jgi:hypothetical protein